MIRNIPDKNQNVYLLGQNAVIAACIWNDAILGDV